MAIPKMLPGTLIDNLTIASLRLNRGKGQYQVLQELAVEYNALCSWLPVVTVSQIATLRMLLGRVNGELWDMEDIVRGHMKPTVEENMMDRVFVLAAMHIPVLNDLRAELKGTINRICGYDGSFEAKIYSGESTKGTT